MKRLTILARGWRREPTDDDSGEEFEPIVELARCPACDGTGKVQRQRPGVLAAARRRAGWTQEQLAKLAGVPRSRLAALELGRGRLLADLVGAYLRIDRKNRDQHNP